mgnify:CR=1 FL=1
MAEASRQRHTARSAYAGLNFIKAATLEFNAIKLAKHLLYKRLRSDEALGELEVADPLHYPRQVTYTDAHTHCRTGTQIITVWFRPGQFRFVSWASPVLEADS